MKSRGIIRDSGKLLLMYRIKEGKEYFTLPGGTVENGETIEQTLYREIKEETNLDIAKKLCVVGKHHIFLIKTFRGEMKLGGPELAKNSGDNQYELKWVSITTLPYLQIQPFEIKEEMLSYFKKEKLL